VLPRAHGSALFTRGETQALVVATLGTARDEQIIDALQGEYRDRFMLHYNLPPYATGETGRVGTPKRREIGHGRLAKRALIAVLPTPRSSLFDARGLRDHRIQRLELDGFGVRRLARTDGCGRADEGARRRHRDGPDQGRQPLCGADRHPRRRGSPRRHGLQGRRHRKGVTALQMDIKIRASPRRSCTPRWFRRAKAACTSSDNEAGARHPRESFRPMRRA
jgi:hypothetical protein